MLVILIEVIYEIILEVALCGMIYIYIYIYNKFHDDWYRHSSNYKVLPKKFEGLYYCFY
jgi:hypothetical protein